MKLIIFKNILFVILALAFSSCIKDKGINEKLPILKTKKNLLSLTRKDLRLQKMVIILF